MKNFRPLCKLYNQLNLKLYIDSKKYSLADILGKDVCPLLFHSIYPYLNTILNGGWFNWVPYNQSVIVNCPSPEGIATCLKARLANLPNPIEVGVIKASPSCYKGYQPANTFIFNFDHKNKINFRILDSLIPYLVNENKDNNRANEFFYNIDGRQIHCRLDFG